MLSSSTVITNQFQGQQLALLRNGNNNDVPRGLDWDKQVLRISNAQLETLDMERIMTVLAETSRPPSAMAGIPSAQISSDIIHLLDEDFRRALDHYRNRLRLLSATDVVKYDNETKRTALTALGSGVIAVAGTAGVGAAISLFGGPRVVITRGVVIGASLGTVIAAGLLGFFSARHAVKIHVENVGSVYRIKWLNEVETHENQRLENVKNTIINVCTVLLIDLNKLKATGEFCESKYLQLQQLHQIFQAMFPSEELRISGNPFLLPARPDQHLAQEGN